MCCLLYTSGVTAADITKTAGVDAPAAGAKTAISFGTKTGADVIGQTLEIGGKKYEFVETGKTAQAGNVAVTVAGTATADDLATALTTEVKKDTDFYDATTGDTKYNVTSATNTVTMTSIKTGVAATAANVTIGTTAGIRFQIGANGSSDQQVTLNVADMSSEGIGIADVSVDTQANANAAIGTICLLYTSLRPCKIQK